MLKMRFTEDVNLDDTRKAILFNTSFETAVFDIYNPDYSSSSMRSSAENSEWCSQISIGIEDKMNAKMDPLFDVHSIEEIKIYSDYNNRFDPPEETKLSLNSPNDKWNPSMILGSPRVLIDMKAKKIDELPSMDNTNPMSSTMPSFSFRNKNVKCINQSLVYISKRLDQNSKEMNKYETIFQNKDGSIKIPEENESRNMHSPSSGPSRNITMFDKNTSGSNYSRYLENKKTSKIKSSKSSDKNFADYK